MYSYVQNSSYNDYLSHPHYDRTLPSYSHVQPSRSANNFMYNTQPTSHDYLCPPLHSYSQQHPYMQSLASTPISRPYSLFSSAQTVPSHTAIHTQPSHTPHREIKPDTFDGKSTDWSDYLIHFEQVASWNQWSLRQKACILGISLRGDAQKLLSTLPSYKLSDYDALKDALTRRFSPQERSLAFRCEFRNRRRMKHESVADYGYEIRRLAQRAYPTMDPEALETCMIDQYIQGLGNFDLQKHVQFLHPRTLDIAISSAVEYAALQGSLDSSKPPDPILKGEAPLQNLLKDSVASLRPTVVTVDDLQEMLSNILDQKLLKLGLADNDTVRQSKPYDMSGSDMCNSNYNTDSYGKSQSQENY